MRIAIIGAGMAGLSAADALMAAGHAVTLFDKGRGPGGRMSTRRMALPDGTDVQFDHGAQYFTARDAGFAAAVEGWAQAGVVARWPVAGADAWVGTPGMNAVIRAMAAAHDVHWATRIDALVADGAGWRLTGADEAPAFDAAVIAVPAEQVAALASPHLPHLAAAAEATRSDPCWTMMAAFPDRLAIDTDTLRDAGAIGWAARNSAKPGRTGPEAWVVQGSPAWSAEHLEEDAPAIADALLAELAAHAASPLPPPLLLTAHRWRYARSGGHGGAAMWDADRRIGACGDWLIGPRIEAAWLSGRALANRIIDAR
ncbi:NAD(P)/FAD-dependent oxidoreductase [Sphingomonas sp. FW199]|uniref:NAD(P)/FAD-dependent oxidoreductase n=1 Tax=Sphingomonas sp. FW199 TaxID=3400217 RepID=UPI003CEB64A5